MILCASLASVLDILKFLQTLVYNYIYSITIYDHCHELSDYKKIQKFKFMITQKFSHFSL